MADWTSARPESVSALALSVIDWVSRDGTPALADVLALALAEALAEGATACREDSGVRVTARYTPKAPMITTTTTAAISSALRRLRPNRPVREDSVTGGGGAGQRSDRAIVAPGITYEYLHRAAGSSLDPGTPVRSITGRVLTARPPTCATSSESVKTSDPHAAQKVHAKVSDPLGAFLPTYKSDPPGPPSAMSTTPDRNTT